MTEENAFSPDALRLLVSVARHGSFTHAAGELNYTQSGVSRRIAGLERAAGGQLFERLPRGVRLTPAGQALHRHAVAVLARLTEAGNELAALRKGFGGRLRIGAFPTANAVLVPAAVREFRLGRPEVELTVVEGLSARLLEDLDVGLLDLAVVSDYPAAVPPAEAGDLVHVMDDEFQIAIAADHPLAGRPRLTLLDLAGEQWIQAAPQGVASRLSEACAREGFAPILGPRIADWIGKFGFVAAGLGVTLVPALAAHAVPADVALRELTSGIPPRSVYAALPAAALASAREFAGLISSIAVQSTAVSRHDAGQITVIGTS